MNKPPNRPWDYNSSKYGGVWFWFDEMVYMNGHSDLKEIKVDVETGKILRQFLNEKHIVRCGECEACELNKLCKFNYFDDAIQDAYREWYQRVFEKTFEHQFVIGEADDS